MVSLHRNRNPKTRGQDFLTKQTWKSSCWGQAGVKWPDVSWVEEGKGESKRIIKDKKRKKIDLKGNKVRGIWESLGRGKGRRKDVIIISKKLKKHSSSRSWQWFPWVPANSGSTAASMSPGEWQQTAESLCLSLAGCTQNDWDKTPLFSESWFLTAGGSADLPTVDTDKT